MVVMGPNFPSGGGGSSKLGRFDAALLLVLKLAGALIGSIFDVIPGCCITVAMLYD